MKAITNKETMIQLITLALSLLFLYASLSKLLNYEKSKEEMMNQVFPAVIARILTWLVPVAEVIIALTLTCKPLRRKALWCSFMLLSAFSLYIAITMSGAFGRIPCSCGGILKNMSYATHLAFNLGFVALAGIALYLDQLSVQIVTKSKGKEDIFIR
ncbi:MauE/DoxX family redox-associated membrane protein [Pedobacter deserti]|uniref:MauE/DoxX family redox-associated membrane protein n=1 Tax=Pedobacter deserti TaxID=2817382 RepID=UPI00210D4855|nr:MauE/DoxX family redox-associated membrane protein [Pedobacter sp. SYSU D00382]